jgi:uncharacterized protein
MKPSEALRIHRNDIYRVVQQNRAHNPRVFGSIVRGEDVDGSDLDLLVDQMPGATLFDMGAIQVELEETLGVPIDVLTPGDLPAKFRARVLQEAIPI